jgi:phosphoglycolate phosphatase
VSIPPASPSGDLPYVRPCFRWDAADAYLFDIDGTLLNCRDAVHFRAFHHAFQDVLGVAASLNGLVLHGNTDIGILRGALRREGLADAVIDSRIDAIVERMCTEVLREREQLQPELCPSIRELLSCLRERGKLLGAASGNLEPIGWIKLERAGLREAFAFGSFAWPRESRVEIFRQGVTLAEERLGRKVNVCVIGDTPADIQAAKATALPVIALATGVYDFAGLRAYQPDVCCRSASELLTLC